MEGNGVAALRAWPIVVDVGTARCRIAPYPAVKWIVPIVDDDWFGIVPGLLDPSDRSIDDALDSGTIRHTDCLRAARNAVGAASGLRWWSAVSLVRSVMNAPEIIGELLLHGIDPSGVGLGAFVAASYRVFVRDADKKQRAKIDSDLSRPPQGLTLEERMDQSPDGSGFEEMMRQRGGTM